MGYSEAEAQASQRANDELTKKNHDDALAQGGTPTEIMHRLEGRQDQVNKTVVNPGAAEYGGGHEGSGVDFYRNEALGHLGDNDALQASNRSAMANSLANMKGNRGPQNQENPNLVSRGNATRNAQLGALDLDRQAALGNAPSEAAFQTRQGMNDIAGQRAGAVGGARGLSGLTGAQGASSAGAGAAAGNLAAAGGMARSKEIGDAIGMYGSQAGSLHQQDFNRLGINDDLQMGNAQNNVNWKLGNANLATQQGQLGNAYGATDAGWQAQAMAPADKQFQYDQEIAAGMNGADADAAGAQIARNRESRDNARNTVNMGVTAGLTAAGSLAGPAGAAAGAAGGGMLGSATSRYW